MANETNMRDLDGNAMPTVADVRKLQRIAAKLRKRYLSARRNSIEIATREAVNYANACGWSKPSPGANSAQVSIWARNWMAAYNRKFAETLTTAIEGRL